MKHKVFWLQLPLIALFTAAFLIDEMGVKGELTNPILRETVLPLVRRVTALHTDLKFKLRGPRPPNNKIVIVEINTPSLDTIGRWPWSRDKSAALIEAIFKHKPRAVGLDIYFSEPEKRIPEALREILDSGPLKGVADTFETDPVLAKVISDHADQIALGWASDSPCQPLYDGPELCPVANAEALETFPDGYDKFAISRFIGLEAFDPAKTPFISLVTPLANIDRFNEAAKHAGLVLALPLDPDGNVRRAAQFAIAAGKPYPSLALEMARIGLNDELFVELDQGKRVKRLGLSRSAIDLPVSPLGAMQLNWRGPSRTFAYVEASDLMSPEPALVDPLNQKLVGKSKDEVLNDAYVFVGITAIGLHDIKATPFDTFTPGVELHATLLDNILSKDGMVSASQKGGLIVLLVAMTVGALLFALGAERLSSIPGIALFAVTFVLINFADAKLFAANQNWNTTFLILEILSIFGFTLAIKYVLEEQNKKFIRAAFTKYVSPDVVDSILKNPDKLQLGGEKQELTILFSDIRSFTTFSEKMDAKALAGFLNDYLSIMTDLVFSHQGTLDKYIGDAVMAFWGAPLPQPNHAANCCKSAIAMMKALRENKDRFKKTYDIDVDIGIGINSGVVNVGNMGSQNNFEYTVIGDSVNLASRLEGLTKAYGCAILTTRFTLDCIQSVNEPLPPHRVIDFVKVKGKKKAVEIVQILDREFDAEGLRIFEEGRQHYEKQHWDDAIQSFRLAADSLAHDGKPDPTSEMYIARCEEFKAQPPGAEWDGSWEMHSK